jgi:hypothetical protein
MNEWYMQELEHEDERYIKYITQINILLNVIKLIKIDEHTIITIRTMVRSINTYSIENVPETKSILTSELMEEYKDYCSNYFMIRQLVFIINKNFLKEIKKMKFYSIWRSFYLEFMSDDKKEMEDIFYS